MKISFEDIIVSTEAEQEPVLFSCCSNTPY